MTLQQPIKSLQQDQADMNESMLLIVLFIQ